MGTTIGVKVTVTRLLCPLKINFTSMNAARNSNLHKSVGLTVTDSTGCWKGEANQALSEINLFKSHTIFHRAYL